MLVNSFCEKEEAEEDDKSGLFYPFLSPFPHTLRYAYYYFCELLDRVSPSAALFWALEAYLGISC